MGRFLCFGRKKKVTRERATEASIEAQLREDERKAKREAKLLLLGAGESGKTTILKQMKLIHDSGYSVEERNAFRSSIYDNLYEALKIIIAALGEDVPPDVAALVPIALDLGSHTRDVTIAEPIWEAIRALLATAAFGECRARAGTAYNMFDSGLYFVNEVDRLSSETYLPSDEDILRCRVTTTGITETNFTIGTMTYKMVDIGGQRSERKKWIHCFEGARTIIFMAAISEYNISIMEDDSVNRMREALGLFDSIVNSRWFNKTSIILFLNKIDLFAEKIKTVPISDYFPDYKGGDDYDDACAYFRGRFESLVQGDGKQIYTHFTCATDSKQIKFVMDAVNDIVVKDSLKQAGLL